MISVHALNDAAALWYVRMAPAFLESSVVALLILCVLYLGRRWPAPLRFGLALVALLKFLVPPEVTSPIGLLRLLPPQASVRPAAESQPPRQLGAFIESAPEAEIATPPAHADRLAAPARPSWQVWMLGAYLAGTIGGMLRIGLQAMRLRRSQASCTVITAGPINDVLRALCRRLGVRRRPRLLLSEHDPAPSAFGVFTPTVVLPQTMVGELSAAQLRAVLAHELAHHHRGDLWLNALQVGLSVVWWFDPLYWWVSRQLRNAREDCCDDLVLARGLSTGATYCETLLRAARLSVGMASAGATLVCRFGTHPLHRRLSRVMRAGFRPAPRISPAHAALLLAIGFVLLPGARRSEPTAATISVAAPGGSQQRGDAQRGTAGRGDLDPALRDLDSREPLQRAQAARKLGEQHALEAIPRLIALLGDEVPIPKAPAWNGPNDWTPARLTWLRPSPGEAAAISLAAMGRDAALPLAAALDVQLPAARRNAAWALGELHGPRSTGLPEVPPLVGALLDADPSVRAAAAWALGEAKDRRATQPLITALRDRDVEVRRWAAHALGELADASAADALLEALEDSDPGVRSTSSWALGEIVDRIGDTARRRGY